MRIAFIAGRGIKSLFTGIDFSSDTAVSSTQLIYYLRLFFYLFIYFIVIADIFFFSNRSFTDSGFRVLVLPR